MSDGKVKLEFTGEEAQLMLKIRRIIQGQRGMTKEAKRTARATGGAAKAGRAFMTSLSPAGIATAMGGLIGIQQVFRAIGDEVQLVFDRMKEIAQLTTETAATYLPAISAMPPQMLAMGPEWRKQIAREAQQAGRVPMAEIVKGMEVIWSSMLAGTPEQSADYLRTAARASGVTAEAQTGLFGGAAAKMADVSQMGPEAGAAAALGLVFKLGSGTPITELGLQAQNIPRALARIVPSDKDFESAAELFLAMTQAQKDPTGLRAGTQAANIAARIRTREVMPAVPGGALEFLPREAVEGRGTLELLEYLRDQLEGMDADRLERERVVGAITESAAGAAFVRGVFQRRPAVEAQVTAARELIGPVDTPEAQAEFADFFEKVIGRAEDIPEVQMLRAQRGMEVSIEQVMRAQPEQAMRGIVLENLTKLQKMMPGGTAMEAKVEQLRALFDTGAEDALTRALGIVTEAQQPQRRARPVREPTAWLGAGARARLGGVMPREYETVAPDPAIVAALDVMAESLRELIALQRETVSAVKKNGDGEQPIRPTLGAADVEP